MTPEAQSTIGLWVFQGFVVAGYALALFLLRRWYMDVTSSIAAGKKERGELAQAIAAVSTSSTAAATHLQAELHKAERRFDRDLFEARTEHARQIADVRELVAKTYISRDEHTHAVTDLKVHMERFEARVLNAIQGLRAPGTKRATDPD